MLLRTASNSHRVLRSLPLRKFGSWTNLTWNSSSVTIHELNDTSFPYVWLRDSCQSSSAIHPSSRQKLSRTEDVDVHITPAAIRAIKDVNGKQAIEVTWADERVSVFGREWLERYANPEALSTFHRDDTLSPVSWTRSSLLSSSSSKLFLQYESLSTSTGLLTAMKQLAQYGLVFIRGVPNQKTSNEDCELKVLAEKFGEIRKTFYGELWDVISLKSKSRNIAYTDLDLGLHMDLLYFEHPPRYQILHSLRNKVVGGTSIFVDALHAAQTLQRSDPSAFEMLTKTPVAFHYINDGHHLHREHCTIELASLAPESTSGRRSSSKAETLPQIAYINYSPPFQAPLPLSTPREFYPALKAFSQILNDPTNTYDYTLQEGDAVMFDNRRVLHARSAFHDKEVDGDVAKSKDDDGSETKTSPEPNRWLKGCYLEADAILDRARVLMGQVENGAGSK